VTDYDMECDVSAPQERERWLSGRKLWMLLCAAGASFVIMLDANIVAVSLPSIARDLHGEFTDVEWVVSAYILPFAALLMPAGALADRLGGVDSWDSPLGGNQIQGCFWEAVLGVMDRLVLSDAAWGRMAPLIIGRPDQKGSTGRDNRMFVEGVLWIVRTGSPWRDLPEAFGDWNSVFRRFSR
jgi:Putative transposase of IS4/5 family (DUF4096)